MGVEEFRQTQVL
ncbi:MAG: hypothetical protein EZS28_041382, partial [Streblomastix strix]